MILGSIVGLIICGCVAMSLLNVILAGVSAMSEMRMNAGDEFYNRAIYWAGAACVAVTAGVVFTLF